MTTRAAPSRPPKGFDPLAVAKLVCPGTEWIAWLGGGLASVARRIRLPILVGAALGCAAQTAPPDRPNVILIVADDLGFSDIGVLGGEIPTPNIDALANGGILFTNFHVAATCSPTRAMLLSGVDNHKAGLGNMGEFLTDEQRGKPGYEGHLNHRVETLASRLGRLGYRTAMAGKWHLGAGPGERPHARGFDRTFALMEGSGSAWSDRSPAPIIGERTRFTRDGEIVERPSGFSASIYVDEMIGFIEASRGDAPFFGYLAFQAVHWPHHAPARFLEKARGRYESGWQAVRDARFAKQRELGLFASIAGPSPLGDGIPPWDTLSSETRRDETARMEAYAAMAMAMDYEIGRLIAYLRTNGLLEGTLLLFVSDNGADPSAPERIPAASAWYERHYPKTDPDELGLAGSFPSTGLAWARVSSTPLAQHKGQPGEGGLRVPFIAHLPGRIAAGQRSDAFGYATDVVPTVLEAVGGVADADLDGRSLWGPMRGAEGDPNEGRPIGYELMGHSALFENDLKLVRRHGEDWRLFDIARDPGETEDLTGVRAAELEQMLLDYRDYEAEMGVVPVPEDYDVMKQLLRSSDPRRR